MQPFHKVGFGIVSLLLLLGAATGFDIPFYLISGPGFSDLFGLDLINVFVFHRCPEAGPDLYAVPGHICGDPEGRPMLYPPLLFFLFGWTQFFSFPTVLYIWTAFSVTMYFLGGSFLLRSLPGSATGSKKLFWFFWVALAIQFPMLFSLERASNDSFVFVLMLVSLFCYSQNKWGWLGFLLVTMTAYKLYPVFVFVMVGASLYGKPGFKKFLLSSCSTAVVLFALFYRLHWAYIIKVLPSWASKQAPHSMGFDHVILNMNYWFSGVGTVMCLLLLGGGLWLARRPNAGTALMIYALAVCTFFQKRLLITVSFSPIPCFWFCCLPLFQPPRKKRLLQTWRWC